jgi:hypothetical protein
VRLLTTPVSREYELVGREIPETLELMSAYRR